ncbi:MAG: hypothetical protein ACM3WS_00635, partial [Bacillota bacterium]
MAGCSACGSGIEMAAAGGSGGTDLMLAGGGTDACAGGACRAGGIAQDDSVSTAIAANTGQHAVRTCFSCFCRPVAADRADIRNLGIIWKGRYQRGAWRRALRAGGCAAFGMRAALRTRIAAVMTRFFTLTVFKTGKKVQNSFAAQKNPSQKRVGDNRKAVPKRHGLSSFRTAHTGGTGQGLHVIPQTSCTFQLRRSLTRHGRPDA